MLAAARALTAPATVAVPQLDGMNAREVTAKLRNLHLHPAFVRQHSNAGPGTAFAQTPAAGTRVKDGSTVSIAISDGPPPVIVPSLTGRSETSAAATLHRRNLNAGVTTVAAPGTTAGVVTRQLPIAGHRVKPRATVELFVAETPSWKTVTSFTADGGGHSVPFQIRGGQWRVVYSMAYDGTCNFVFFCNGPSAQIVGGSGNPSFDLNSGSGQTKVFTTGPGMYQINVNAGWDSAHWSIEVQDWY
jgi:hypothetical protein